ncbi:MAG TPA: response regulator transcription factor, partial [Kiritimatiellia bacterium]|nr:response regulator transcription factor [Kiritimatiellia bacterium]
LSLEDGSGLDLIKDVHARNPALPMLVLSMHPEHLYAERAIRAGARGYLMKREPVERVLAALRKVLAGQMAVSDDVVSRLLSGANGRAKREAPIDLAELLSDRELDVFRALGQGLGTRQIAAKLRLAVSTIETHRANIKLKLGVTRAPELVARAARFVAND